MEKGVKKMKELNYRIIPAGALQGRVPMNIILIDIKDLKSCGLTCKKAALLLAKDYSDPTTINYFDMDSVTVTSDGIMVDGAIVALAALDFGKLNEEYGFARMGVIPYSERIISEEPHLRQWDINYKGRELHRGIFNEDRTIDHNGVISGRTCNNNCGTEMFNLVTMKEIIFPYLGQLEIMRDGNVLVGTTGEVISVGIGMTVAEWFGRIFNSRQYRAGDTAHASGDHAKTLKAEFPCIVADKKVVAEYTIRALEAGMIPGKDIGCSPVVLSLAKALGKKIDYDNITENAWRELSSIGITRKWLEDSQKAMTKEEVLAKVDEIIPGVESPEKHKTTDFAEWRTLIV